MKYVFYGTSRKYAGCGVSAREFDTMKEANDYYDHVIATIDQRPAWMQLDEMQYITGRIPDYYGEEDTDPTPSRNSLYYVSKDSNGNYVLIKKK